MTKTIPWWSPQITGQEYALVKDVLDSDYLNDGDVTTRFEQEVAQLVGAKHAVAVTSGTIALFLALAGVGVGPGDEVIVPDVTFIATANAVMLTGARPVPVMAARTASHSSGRILRRRHIWGGAPKICPGSAPMSCARSKAVMRPPDEPTCAPIFMRSRASARGSPRGPSVGRSHSAE